MLLYMYASYNSFVVLVLGKELSTKLVFDLSYKIRIINNLLSQYLGNDKIVNSQNFDNTVSCSTFKLSK